MRSWFLVRDEAVGAGMVGARVIFSSSFLLPGRVVYCHPFIVVEAMIVCVEFERQSRSLMLLFMLFRDTHVLRVSLCS